MKLYIGTTVLHGQFTNYIKRFNGLELRSDAGNLPRPSRLSAWAAEAGPEFGFSVALPQSLGALPSEAVQHPELARALEVARQLRAHWLVLRTPPNIGPSTRAHERLRGLAVHLRGAGFSLAWEPHGPWSEEQCASLAAEGELHWVRDLAQNDAPAGERVYTRLLAQGAPLRPSALARVAERLLGHSEAWVIVEGEQAAWAARKLRQELSALLGQAAALAAQDAEEDEDWEEPDESADEEEDEDEESS